MFDVAWILNCEIADNPAHFVLQKKPNFVLWFHSRTTVGEIIDRTEVDLLIVAGDRCGKDTGDIFRFSGNLICRSLKEEKVINSHWGHITIS